MMVNKVVELHLKISEVHSVPSSGVGMRHGDRLEFGKAVAMGLSSYVYQVRWIFDPASGADM